MACTENIYKDSWAEANDLADGSGFWKEKASRIGNKDVWGGGRWMGICEWARTLKIFVLHVNSQQK